MPGATVHIWMAMDPESRRITAQDREWADGDFPPGFRGLGWPRREADVPKGTWTKLCHATLPPDSQDKHHRQWWDDARPEGAPLWPET